MTCAESQELLLDLAYGELPPARAAEVEAHVQGCAACQAEKQQLEDARRMAAPLREAEEPSAAFDGPILRAARAEAGMQADGTPGPVVEVSASVKPLGLQAARLDPHARMKGAPGQARPRWAFRAAVVGSIAAAAGLAVVVTSSLTTNHARDAAREEVAPIQVRAPGSPVSTAVDDALAPRERGPAANQAPAAKSEAPAPQQPPPGAAVREPAKVKATRKEQPPQALPEKDVRAGGAIASGSQRGGAGGTTAPAVAASPDDRAARATAPPAAEELPARREAERKPDAAKAAKISSSERQIAAAQPEPRAAPATAQPQSEARAPAGTVDALSGGVATPAAGARPDADRVEDEASAARRGGDYPRAAVLYRQASALRRDSDPARSAWDLAHAVECLAAGGQFDDAIATRKELLRVFPGQTGPKAAADSALRSVRLPPDEEKPAKQ